MWVISRAGPDESHTVDDRQPRSGALLARIDEKQDPVPVPLKHTDVKASIAGYIATVDVTQQYHNPYSSKIEAIYVFPLPANAAVTEFVMTAASARRRRRFIKRPGARVTWRRC